MSLFLNPWLIGGAAFAAVPVILHLVMRQQPKHLVFPALRFIQQKHETNRRQMRLRHWLLLLARMAVIALLAFALARPSINASGFLGDRAAPVAAALVFDTLPHMDYRQENQTRLEAAKETGAWLLGQLPEDSQIAVVDSSPGPAVFQVDLGAARQRIDRLETEGVTESLWRSIVEAVELLKTSTLNKEIYVFTDLAAASWNTDSATPLEAVARELRSIGIYLIDVGVEKPQNFALGDLRLSAQVLARNSPLSVGAELSAVDMEGQRVVEAYLLNRAGEEEKRSQETVDVVAGSATPVEAVLGGLDVGTHQGFLRIVGGDGLAADDKRYFSVEVRDAWRVLVAAPNPPDEQSFYFVEALAPAAFRKNGQARFDCTVIGYDKLAEQALENYSAVFLLDPPALGDAAWQQVSTYALAGGGVAIFLGPQAKDVQAFNQPAAQELLPGPLGIVARYPDGDTYLVPDEVQHPLLEKFRPLRGSIAWESFPVFRYWQLTKLAEGVGVIVPFSNRRPALLEKPVGKGRVLTMTTPVSEPLDINYTDRWNLLPTGFEPWPFVMFANELALYLVGSIDGQLNYFTGQSAVVRLDGGPLRPTYQVRTPRGDELRVSPDGQQSTLTFTATEVPGNYTIQAGGMDDVRLGFSVNLPSEASRLERIDRTRLEELFGDVKVRVARSREEIDTSMNTTRVGEELFPLLIVAMAVFLGLEGVMANRFYREK